MRPERLRSKIFLDSGDPAETKAIIAKLGFLDGQTTNPSLVGKNPQVRQRLESGQKFTKQEVDEFYKGLVQQVSQLIPDGSVSIEVYADRSTTAEEMSAQGSEMYTWIPNAHIKYPTTPAGLAAAQTTVKSGKRVNMTLCFTQEQAAAVYAATQGANPGQVYVSPFIGRLDDKGINGMSLIANILKMYEAGDGHSQVLAASIRTMDHFMQSLDLGADIITAPYTILEQWAQAGLPLPADNFSYEHHGLTDIAYAPINLELPWSSYDLRHELTDKGVDRFSADWNELIT